MIKPGFELPGRQSSQWSDAVALALVLSSVIAACTPSRSGEASLALEQEPPTPIDGPIVLFNTYGQFVDVDGNTGGPPEFHEGIDLGACPAVPVRVLAVEAGYVVRATFAMADEVGRGDANYIIISRGKDRGHGIRYAHLAETPLALGDWVCQGDYVGSICEWIPKTFKHLHLQLVQRGTTGIGSASAWGIKQVKDDGNPLLALAGFADSIPPAVDVPPNEGGQRTAFSFFSKGPDGSELSDPDRLCGPVAIVAGLRDQCGNGEEELCPPAGTGESRSSSALAPLGFELQIWKVGDTAAPVKTYRLSLSRVDNMQVKQVYQASTSEGTYCKRNLRFVLTYDPANFCAWNPPCTGDYLLRLRVNDVKQETIEPDFRIHVSSLQSP